MSDYQRERIGGGIGAAAFIVSLVSCSGGGSLTGAGGTGAGPSGVAGTGGVTCLGGSGGSSVTAECGCAAATAESVHRPLSCLCGGGCSATCPATIDDYDTNVACSGGGTLVRVTGCGKVSFQLVGYGGTMPTFDSASGALVGVEISSDIPFGACGVHAYFYGQGLLPPGSFGAAPADECPQEQIQRCKVCGSLSSDPPCS